MALPPWLSAAKRKQPPAAKAHRPEEDALRAELARKVHPMTPTDCLQLTPTGCLQLTPTDCLQLTPTG